MLGVLILVFSFSAWLNLSGALNNGPDWLAKSLWSLAAFLILGVGAGLAYLVEDRKILFYGLPPLIILPALVFLKDVLLSGAVLAVALLFLALASWRADFEKSLRIEFIVGVILRKSLAPFITALALITTLFFYWAPFTQSLEQKIYVPRPLFDVIVQPTIDLFLQMTLPAGQSLKDLPPEAIRQQTQFLDEMYLSVNEELANAGQAFKKWLPLGVSVSLFFTFKVIGIFLSWLMILLAWIIFRVLLWSKIVKIAKVAAEKEVIIM